jgi:two-component system NarL family sensor kinase
VAIRLQLDLISAALSDPEPAVVHALDHAAMLIAEAHGQVRAVSSRLHPPEWQRLTLEQALRRLWDISGISQHYTGELRIELLTTEPDLDAKTLIYRAMQEALSNLIRHAGASRIDIVLARRGPWLVLEAQDNGKGFDPARRSDASGATAGLGLRAIQELTEELRGQFLVETGPSGTKLVVSIPFH